MNIIEKIKKEVNLGKEQEEIILKMEYTTDNMFIQGSAGVGKSYISKIFLKYTTKDVVALSTTGVSALNIGGQTVHSFFGIGPYILDIDDPENDKIPHKTIEILKYVDTIMIDEISMLSPNVLEIINRKCQKVRKSILPFGGIQMIFIGDLYQLPPVVKRNLRKYFKEVYGGRFFFQAPVIKDNGLLVYELQHIYRQKDVEFQKILNNIRIGYNSNDILSKINEQVKTPPTDEDTIILTTRNSMVDYINNIKLKEIDSMEILYKAEIDGIVPENSFPTDKEIHLKIGAQVMMIQNDTSKFKRWVNGDIGTITELENDYIKVKIREKEYIVDKHTWDNYSYDISDDKKIERQVIGHFKQFPVKLAWAMTIHKSQGKTYNSVYIDFCGGTFDAGQAYVALSRCTSLEKIYLKSNIKPEDIKVSIEVSDFMQNTNIIKFSNIEKEGGK